VLTIFNDTVEAVRKAVGAQLAVIAAIEDLDTARVSSAMPWRAAW